MEVPPVIVYFLIASHGIARLSQAAGDGDGKRRDFSLLPSIAPSY
jgi:hypothetical protein